MKVAAAKVAPVSKPKKKRDVQTTELNQNERRRLDDLILRFQEIVVARNKRFGERERADAGEADMVRAGMLRLEQVPDNEFYDSVTKAKNERP